MAYQNEVELYPALQRSSLETPPVHVYLPMIREERRPPSALLGLGLEHSEHGVCEGSAAFGCLAELATRRGSPLRPAGAPQEDLQSSPSSLPRRILVPAERCKPPYSREWLLAHRAHCGGSPLRPTVLHPRPSCSPSRHSGTDTDPPSKRDSRSWNSNECPGLRMDPFISQTQYTHSILR